MAELRDACKRQFLPTKESLRLRFQALRNISVFTSKNTMTYWRGWGAARWSPQNDSKPWIRFCITAHYRQAQILLRRSREFERVYGELEELIKKYSMPERMALALTQAAFGRRVRNSSYRVSAEISKNLASRDLKELVDAGLLIAEGERRGRQ